jgi:hypothetical protein
MRRTRAETRAMRTGLARAIIAIVALAAAALLLVLPFYPALSIDFGLTLERDGPSDAARVVGVAPGSIAARAGIHAGDRLMLADDTADERIRVRTLRAGEPVTYRVQSAGASRDVVLRDPAPARASSAELLLQALLFLSYAGIALLIVRRRSDDARALELAAFLALFAFGAGASSLLLQFVRSYWWVVVGLAAQSAYALGGGFATLFCSSFPQPAAGGFRGFVRRATPAVTLIAIVFTFVGIAGPYFWPSSDLAILSLTPFSLCWVFFIAGSLGSLGLSLARARGLERQQLLWVALTFGLGFSGLAVLFASVAITHKLGGARFASLTVAAIPFGLAYVILRHRVVDVGFALNRAAVFGAVSLTVVLTFSIIEWLVEKYVVVYGHVASDVVQLGVALGIGFGLRPLHAGLDRFVDDLFFRQRHERELRLRRFARELPYFTDAAIALERVGSVLGEAADTAAVSVYSAVPQGYKNGSGPGPALLDANDPAVITLKAFHEPDTLDGSGSALGDGLAFGLYVRGEMIGILALGPKRGGEDYAPDERDALEAVAGALASLLDALEIAHLRQRLALQVASASVPG